MREIYSTLSYTRRFGLDAFLRATKSIFRAVGALISKARDTEMLKTLLGLTATAAMMSTSVAAHALTLTNRDRTAHTVAILEEDDEWSATIQPGETLRNLCVSRCSIAIGPDEDRDFQGFESVSIVDGRLILTRSTTGGAAALQNDGQPQAPEKVRLFGGEANSGSLSQAARPASRSRSSDSRLRIDCGALFR